VNVVEQVQIQVATVVKSQARSCHCHHSPLELAASVILLKSTSKIKIARTRNEGDTGKFPAAALASNSGPGTIKSAGKQWFYFYFIGFVNLQLFVALGRT